MEIPMSIIEDIQKNAYDKAVMEVRDCISHITSKSTKSVELHLVLKYERENSENKTAGGGTVTYTSNLLENDTISFILNRHLNQIKSELDTIISTDNEQKDI